LKSYFLTLLILTGSFVSGYSQACPLRISLLTCAPGEELYSTFGHTAIRVQDSIAGTDIVFNYGTFEFGPDFYTKFIKGKLNYFLSAEQFPDFVSTYQYESRSIIEQQLALDCSEKQKLFSALQTNAMPENRNYRYDFLYDNCTTRARDIIRANTSSPLVFKNILDGERPSFRDLIHRYLDAGNQKWSKLGIDILLGADLDKKATNEQAMFLPDNLLKGIDSSVKNGNSLTASKQTILALPSPLSKANFFTPLVVFSNLLLLLLIFSFVNRRTVRAVIAVFDFLFFFLLGLGGIVLLFMWFGTDHVVCRNNYNLLWALPTHLVGAFFVRSNRRWTNYYWLATILFATFLLIAWLFIPQELNLAVLPILLMILLRAWLIILKPHHENKEAEL
jgi:hypothetical protein